MAAAHPIISAEALFEKKGLWYPWVTDVLACKKNEVQISVKSEPYMLGTWLGPSSEKGKKKKGKEKKEEHDIPDWMWGYKAMYVKKTKKEAWLDQNGKKIEKKKFRKDD